MRVLIALACFLPLVFGATFEWRGANTNWNEKANWQGTAPTDGCPANLDLTGNTLSLAVKPIITSRLVGDVVAGGSIKFPTNGRIILSDASKIKFNPDCSGSSAVFVGGMKNLKSNALNCRANYFVAGKPATRVPCEGDTVVIPADKTVRVWSSERINLDLVKFGTTNFDTCNAIGADSTVSSQLGVTCGRGGNFLLKDPQPCVDSGEVNAEGVCQCFENTECLSDAELRAQAELERLAAEKLALQNAQAMSVNVTKTFTGTFTPASLGVDPQQLLDIFDSPESTAEFKTLLAGLLADAWGIPVSQVQISQFDVTQGGIGVTIAGTVVGPVSAFIEPGQSPTQVTSGAVIVTGSGTSQIQVLIRTAVTDAIIQQTQAMYEAQIALLLQSCGDAAGCADAKAFLEALAATYVNPAGAYAAMRGCETLPCLESELKAPTLVLQDGKNSTDIDAVIALAAKLIPIEAGSPVDSFLDSAADLATKINNVDQQAAALPKDTTVSSPVLVVGQTRPRTDLAHLLSSVNQPTLKFALKFALSPFLIIKKVDLNSMTLDLKFGTARRAISDADLPTAITLVFNYITICNPSDLRNCGFKLNDATYKDVVARINDVIAAFDIQPHHACYDFTTGYDSSCLKAAAQTAYNAAKKNGTTDAQALEISKQAILRIIECGDFGRKPDGNCVLKDVNSASSANTYAAQAQASYVPGGNGGGGGGGGGNQQGSTGSSGGGLPLGIVAGAAGGGLLIIILVIVIVVRRRKSSGGSAKRADDRTVVAFENPMYDDPAQNAQAQYEATDAHGSDGLYDEPAYNQQASLAKSNPMYESTENIAAAGGEEGGYLDVAPENN